MTTTQPYLTRTPRVLIGSWVPASKRLAIQEIATRKGQSVSATVAEALDEYLTREAR